MGRDENDQINVLTSQVKSWEKNQE